MIDTLFTDPLQFLSWAIALILGITIHEFSHAFVADRLGDPTPKIQGRLTLNPLRHLDPIGTLMILLIRFGWGKPVEFDPFNLKHPRRDAALISIAGPVSNLTLATILSLIIRLTPTSPLTMTLLITVYFNVLLAIFNLIPVHPLDGFKIVGGLLSEDQAKEWYSLERYGFIFLLLLILPIGGRSLLSNILYPTISFILQILLGNLGVFS